MTELELTEINGKKVECATLFCQLNEFVINKTGKDRWFEHSRWIKFEEVVENTGEHWSKPHVGLLNFGSIHDARKNLLNGAISLNHEGKSLHDILSNAFDLAINEEHIDKSLKSYLMKIFQMSHTRPVAKLSLTQRGSEASLARLGLDTPNYNRRFGSRSLLNVDNSIEEDDVSSANNFDSKFKKKIPVGSEVANILVAELPLITKSVAILLRLKESQVIAQYSEVDLPTKFIIILLGPLETKLKLFECGRVIGSLLADNVFRKTMYLATGKTDVLHGIDEFIRSAFVIPPSEWNPEVRIDPPKDKVPFRHPITANSEAGDGAPPMIEEEVKEEEVEEIELVRTHRFCGGLIDDIKRKSKFYLSDFKDALHVQCFATYAFLYFACLSPIITFGGLLMTATDGYLGAIESVISGAIVGMAYSLFAGQPLTILSSTGPILVFESIMFRICTNMNWDFLTLRMWIGLWLMFYLLIMVAFDLSVLVKYITKFTEDCFAMLIALIYIVEALQNIFALLDDYPLNRKWDPSYVLNRTCVCIPPNSSSISMMLNDHTRRLLNFEKPPLLLSYTNQTESILKYIDWNNISDGYFSWQTRSFKRMCVDYGGHWSGNTCGKLYVPDVFFVSWLLMIGTFCTAWGLKLFRGSRLLPNIVRHTIGNFAIVISIVIFTLIDVMIGVQTPKLIVPDKLEPTLGFNVRGWVTPFLGKNPWWSILFAAVPAMLAVILIFLDQQITTVIINRKRNKLQKGYGYHLDLFVVAILIGINSIMGVPWFVAGTVLSMNHVMSLKKESVSNAPGEKPEFYGVRENRVTGFMIFFTVGISVFLTRVLQKIPMPVLYGVFMYMGVSPLGEIDFIQRIGLFFMTSKNRPDYKYLRFIPIRRVHFFTIIEILSLGALWAVKSIKSLAIGFPLMVLAMCFIRKGLDWIFSKEELKYLDQLLPSTKVPCCGKKSEDEDIENKKPLFPPEAPIITIEGPSIQ